MGPLLGTLCSPHEALRTNVAVYALPLLLEQDPGAMGLLLRELLGAMAAGGAGAEGAVSEGGFLTRSTLLAICLPLRKELKAMGSTGRGQVPYEARVVFCAPRVRSEVGRCAIEEEQRFGVRQGKGTLPSLPPAHPRPDAP